MDPASPFSIPFSFVGFDLLPGLPVTYDENAVTDIQIACFYARSPLYELGGIYPFDAEGRADELERVRNVCDPCAENPTSVPLFSASNEFAVSETRLADPQCESVVITIEPSSVTVAKGGTAQFTATVTGASDTSVTWSAGGGSITQDGVYTAGSASGSFTVTATSVADPSVSAEATVNIPEGNPIGGQWLGDMTITADTGRVDTCANLAPENPDDCVEFAFKDDPWTPGFPETVRARLFTSFPVDNKKYYFTGSFDGNTFTGERTRVETDSGTQFEEPPGCEITLTVTENTIVGLMPEGTISQGCDGKRQTQIQLTCAEEQGCSR